MSQGEDFAQNKALRFAGNHIDIYACAWGPDGVLGNLVGYNKAIDALANGTKYVRTDFTK